MESGEGEKRENCSTSLGKRLLRTPPAPARGTAVRRAIRAAFMAAVAAVGGCSDASKLLAAPLPVGALSRAASIYTHTGGRCSSGPAPPRRRSVPLPEARDGRWRPPLCPHRSRWHVASLVGKRQCHRAAPSPGAALCPPTLVRGQCQPRAGSASQSA